MCLPVGGLPDFECLYVDNTSWGVQMLDCLVLVCTFSVYFPLCPFLVSGGLCSRQHRQISFLALYSDIMSFSKPRLKHKALLVVKFEECLSLFIQ